MLNFIDDSKKMTNLQFQYPEVEDLFSNSEESSSGLMIKWPSSDPQNDSIETTGMLWFLRRVNEYIRINFELVIIAKNMIELIVTSSLTNLAFVQHLILLNIEIFFIVLLC